MKKTNIVSCRRRHEHYTFRRGAKEMNYSKIYIYSYIYPALPLKRYDLSIVDYIRTWHEFISMDHESSHAIDTENSFVSKSGAPKCLQIPFYFSGKLVHVHDESSYSSSVSGFRQRENGMFKFHFKTLAWTHSKYHESPSRNWTHITQMDDIPIVTCQIRSLSKDSCPSHRNTKNNPKIQDLVQNPLDKFPQDHQFRIDSSFLSARMLDAAPPPNFSPPIPMDWVSRTQATSPASSENRNISESEDIPEKVNVVFASFHHGFVQGF